MEKKIIQTENELKRENNKLKKANLELDEVTSGIVHDLKRPLRSMGSFAQLAHRRLPQHAGEDIKEYLEYITKSASRMSGLLDAIMNFSKANSASSKKEKVVLDQVMDEVKLNVLDLINEKDAEIYTFNLPVLFSNKFQMMQLLQNLLENAIKYNTNEQPKVILEATETDTHHIISVKDNGIGIEDDYKEKVFELFQRLNPHLYEGTGVGLATCRKIVENHHGKIWLESEEGRGTTFFIKFPKPKSVKMYNKNAKGQRKVG